MLFFGEGIYVWDIAGCEIIKNGKNNNSLRESDGNLNGIGDLEKLES